MKVDEEIEKLIDDTIKFNRNLKWYVVIVIIMAVLILLFMIKSYL